MAEETIFSSGDINIAPNETQTIEIDCSERTFTMSDECEYHICWNVNREIYDFDHFIKGLGALYPLIEERCSELTGGIALDVYEPNEKVNSYFGIYDDVRHKAYLQNVIVRSEETVESFLVPNKVVKETYENHNPVYTEYQADVFGLNGTLVFDNANIKNVILSEGYSDICSSNVFNNCDKLETITFPASMQRIHSEPIGYCPKLRAIYSKNPIPPTIVVPDSFKDGLRDKTLFVGVITYIDENGNFFNKYIETDYENITLYVPIGCREAYAEAWSAFLNIVEMDVEDMPSTTGVDDTTKRYLWTGDYERGGKAEATDGVSVGYENAGYTTIRLNGRPKWTDGDYITVTLDKPLHAGDKISVTAYRNKKAANKKSGVRMELCGENIPGTVTVASSTGLEFVNIDQSDDSSADSNRGTEPNTCEFEVPAEADGCTWFYMTRSHAETNLFITKLQIEGNVTQGDVNGDGAVDVADIASVISVMAKGNNDKVADVNRDGVVDVADIATIIDIMAANARRQDVIDE